MLCKRSLHEPHINQHSVCNDFARVTKHHVARGVFVLLLSAYATLIP
jgi:hypothetical protein